jgi:hypothetical protein
MKKAAAIVIVRTKTVSALLVLATDDPTGQLLDRPLESVDFIEVPSGYPLPG